MNKNNLTDSEKIIFEGSKPTSRTWTREKELKAVQLKSQGKTYKEVGKELGLIYTTVYQKFWQTGFICLTLEECEKYDVLHTVQINKKKVRTKPVRKLFNLETRIIIKNKFNGRCGYCGKEKGLEIDHIVSISKGGTDELENLMPSCFECNRLKAASSIEEFRKKMFQFCFEKEE